MKKKTPVAIFVHVRKSPWLDRAGLRMIPLLLLALLVLSACGKTSPGIPLPSDAIDVSDIPPPDSDVPPPDPDVPPDIVAGECEPDNNGKMPTFCPCEENTECAEGYCIPSVLGKICTETCIEDCPDGWSCELLTGLGNDKVYVCFPNALELRGHLMGDGFVLSSNNGQFSVQQSTGTPRIVGVTSNSSFTVTPGFPQGGK